MGGKGSAPAPPPVDYAPMQAAMSQMMAVMGQMPAMMQSMISSMPQVPEPTPLPQVFTSPTVDWTEKQAEIDAKAKADYNIDEARRKSRTDTILTSPLLDDEEVETVTGSVLAGS